jgi:hypothetical protein
MLMPFGFPLYHGEFGIYLIAGLLGLREVRAWRAARRTNKLLSGAMAEQDRLRAEKMAEFAARLKNNRRTKDA